jgi:hypothetical protein
LVDAGSIDAATVGHKELAINQTLEPGLYWLVFIQNDATLSLYSSRNWPSLLGDDDTNASPKISYIKSQAYGDLPVTFPVGANVYSELWLLALYLSAFE